MSRLSSVGNEFILKKKKALWKNDEAERGEARKGDRRGLQKINSCVWKSRT